MKKAISVTFIVAMLVIACARVEQPITPAASPTAGSSPVLSTSIPTSPTPEIVPSIEIEIEEEPTETLEYILPADAGNYLGQQVTVILPSPSCSYKEFINGSPTFCNDKPYPDHTFTLLVWGEDWSFLDGKCLLVTGEVSEYEGKYQIIATDLSQVAFC